MMKRTISFMLALLLLALLAGCGQTSGTPTSGDAAGTGSGTGADAGSAITVVLSTVGNNLDPCAANAINTTTIVNHVYDNLLECDEAFNVVPGVASAWEQPDPLTYELTIGDGFVFHNGEPLEMEDVAYSVERLANIAQTANLAAQIDSVSVSGNTLTIVIKEANSGFLRDLTTIPVLNKSYCEEKGDAYANEPVGTGPYTVSAYTPGDSVTLTRWEDYPGEKPAIESIHFRGIEESSTAYMAVEAGDADITTVSAVDYGRAQSNEKLTFTEGPTTFTSFVSMNTQSAPFDNPDVRRAMAYAYNKEGYLNVQGENYAAIDSMFLAMTEYYYHSPETITYDLDKARELLAAAGYNEANPLTFEISGYNSDDAVMQAYQADLASIGVKAELVTYEFGVFLDNMASQNFQMLAGGWGDTTGNPLSAAECYYSGSFGSMNISFYENPICDQLYVDAKNSSDDSEVVELCKELQDIAWQDVPMFPTFTRTEAYAYNKALSGVVISPSGVLSFRSARLG